MKNLLFISLLLSSITFYSNTGGDLAKTYSGSGDSVKVILSITHNDKNISERVRGALNLINGVNVVAYCDNHAVFMLFLDGTIVRDSNDLKAELKKIYPKTEDQISFKEGDFNQFLQYCTPSNVNDAANLKKLSTN